VISSDTVLRRLRKHNLTSHPSATGPRLNAKHRRQRLKFVRMHADWGMDDWRRVLFTDESRFTQYSPDLRQKVFRRPGERYAQCCFASKVPFGGGGVMIWGGISLAGCTALVTLRRGSINADRYIRIRECLEEHGVPFAPFVGVDFLLMHDNARPHVAQITRQYLHDVGIQVLRWPPMSPDLNPIEHLWDNLGRSIRQNYGEFHTVVQLERALLHEWEVIPQDEIVALITSMPGRLRAVIQARGGNTRY
jgi:hypothetical protein